MSEAKHEDQAIDERNLDPMEALIQMEQAADALYTHHHLEKSTINRRTFREEYIMRRLIAL